MVDYEIVNPGVSRTNEGGYRPQVETINSNNNDTPAMFAGVLIAGANMQFPSQQEMLSANTYQIPNNFTVNIISADGGGGAVANTRIYIMQETTSGLANIVDNNGSGAGSITATYPDGFAGRLLSNGLKNARGGVGAPCVGVQVECTVTATGESAPSSLSQAQAYFAIWNMMNGTVQTVDVNVASNHSRSDQDKGVSVIPVAINWSPMTQFSMVIVPLRSVAFTSYQQYGYKI